MSRVVSSQEHSYLGGGVRTCEGSVQGCTGKLEGMRA